MENRSSDTGNSRFALKGKEKGLRELALFLWRHSCRKDRFFLRSLCRPSSRQHKTRLTSEMRFCTSSNLNGRTTSPSFYHRLSMCFSHIAHYDAAGFYETCSRRMPTGYASCVTRSRGRAGAIQSTRFAMSSAPSSTRFASATISLAMTTRREAVRSSEMETLKSLRRSIDWLLIKRRLRYGATGSPASNRKSQSRAALTSQPSDHNIGST